MTTRMTPGLRWDVSALGRVAWWLIVAAMMGGLQGPGAGFTDTAAAAATAAQAGQGEIPEAKPRPNMIVFLADDLGWGDLGCYGHPVIKTPQLDGFARQGLLLRQCYSASAVCSPSRSAILTGRTPYRNGVFTWIPDQRDLHLRASEITIAKLLRQVGYTTCHVGKWHLNGHFNSPLQPQPNDHGYDWWMATQNNAAPSHKDPINFVRNAQPLGPLKGYSADLVVDEAIGWLTRHRDPSKPFLLMVWTHEPHLPIESDPQHQSHYADLADPQLRQHHGNVTQIDAAFGRLMATLDGLKLADNTLVVFTSDNGPEGDGKSGRTRGSTGGLRGRKRSVFEGGIRVPGLVRFPGVVKPGSVSETPVVGSDLFVTLAQMGGAAVPTDRVIDGRDLGDLFKGGTVRRDAPLYWRCAIGPTGCKTALRDGDYKLIADEELTRFMMFNLAEDPTESRDLAASPSPKLAEMVALLRKVNAEIEADGPDWWKSYSHDSRVPAKRQPSNKTHKAEKPE